MNRTNAIAWGLIGVCLLAGCEPVAETQEVRCMAYSFGHIDCFSPAPPEAVRDKIWSGQLNLQREAIAELLAAFQQSPTPETLRAIRDADVYLSRVPELWPELTSMWVAVVTSPAVSEAGSGFYTEFAFVREGMFPFVSVVVNPRVLAALETDTVFEELVSCAPDWGEAYLYRDLCRLFYEDSSASILQQRIATGTPFTREQAIHVASWVAPEAFLATFARLVATDPEMGSAAFLAMLRMGCVEEAWRAFDEASPAQQDYVLGRSDLPYGYKPGNIDQRERMLAGLRGMDSERGVILWAIYAGWDPVERDHIRDLFADPELSFSDEIVARVHMLTGSEVTLDEALDRWADELESVTGQPVENWQFLSAAYLANGDERFKSLLLETAEREYRNSYAIGDLAWAAYVSGTDEFFEEYAFAILLQDGDADETIRAMKILDAAIPEQMHAFYLSALNCDQPLDDYAIVEEGNFPLHWPEDDPHHGTPIPFPLEYWRLRAAWQGADYFRRATDPAAVEPLVGLLDHECLMVTLAAIEALGNQGDASVIGDLEPFLESRAPGLRSAARAAIDRLGAEDE